MDDVRGVRVDEFTVGVEHLQGDGVDFEIELLELDIELWLDQRVIIFAGHGIFFSKNFASLPYSPGYSRKYGAFELGSGRWRPWSESPTSGSRRAFWAAFSPEIEGRHRPLPVPAHVPGKATTADYLYQVAKVSAPCKGHEPGQQQGQLDVGVLSLNPINQGHQKPSNSH